MAMKLKKQTYQRKELVKIVGIKDTKFQSWQDRGFFQHTNNPHPGKAYFREYSYIDIFRLALMTELHKLEMIPETANNCVTLIFNSENIHMKTGAELLRKLKSNNSIGSQMVLLTPPEKPSKEWEMYFFDAKDGNLFAHIKHIRAGFLILPVYEILKAVSERFF